MHAPGFVSPCDTICDRNPAKKLIPSSFPRTGSNYLVGKTKIFIIEIVFQILIGPDGWRNGSQTVGNVPERDALRCHVPPGHRVFHSSDVQRQRVKIDLETSKICKVGGVGSGD